MSVDVIELIKTVRDSFIGAKDVYTRGSCYRFYKILKCVFPKAEAYYDGNHVITEIDGKFYDIRGEVAPDRHLKMSEHYPNSMVTECRFRIDGFVMDCPKCKEEIEINL